MADSLSERLKRAWNVFSGKDEYLKDLGGYTFGSTYRSDRIRLTKGNERSIVTAIFNRIGMDVAAIDIKHVRLDQNDRYKEDIDSPLNYCLTCEPNIDQTARSFIQDVVMSMFDEGAVAICPIETSFDPRKTNSYDIWNLRTGRIIEWYPQHVKVSVYNEMTGKRENVIYPKKVVGIIENPLYAVMNEPNSTLQRLIRKLNLLDVIDEQSGAGKLDLIIQLPYVIKTDLKREQAEKRRAQIEDQLAGSKYGIAYTDGTERITQLNRSVNNNLMSQIEYLTSMLYSQLGITQSLLDGTAEENVSLNYMSRTIEPVISAITDELERKFLTKTARTQGQAIRYFVDPFKLTPTSQLAEMADKFTRNEIMTSNEIRQAIGLKPSTDPEADELRNKNLSKPKDTETVDIVNENEEEVKDNNG